MPKKTTSLLLRLPPELHRRLKTAAKLDGRSMNSAVIQAIRRWLGEG